jgi:hypothetical protein
MPPNRGYWQEYAEQWVAVKVRWGLTADAREIAILRKILGSGYPIPTEPPESVCGDLAESGSSAAAAAVVEVLCGGKRYCKEMTPVNKREHTSLSAE